MNIYFEADYFSKFQCKCGRCRHSCCGGWQIDISQQEFYRLIGMECSEKLHEKIECAMAIPPHPSVDAYRIISPNWLGRCPMQGDDGLCLLQKECGESTLPAVCRLYPRTRRKTGAYCHACCSGSCEEVIELLLQEDALGFRVVEDEEAPLLCEAADEDYPNISLECMAILQNRSLPMRERLLRIADCLGAESIPSEDKLEAILPELLTFSPELSEYLSREVPPITDVALENVLANHLLYMSFPYVDGRLSKKDAFPGLLMTEYLLRRVGMNVDGMAFVFHLTEHTAFYYNVKVMLER